MSRLLVHLHIFYPEQIDYFLSKLANIQGCEWDLVVTSPSDLGENKDHILAFKPGTRFETVENLGYDVWPFLKVLRETVTENFDYVLKLHTKGTNPHHFNGLRMKNFQWRDIMVEALLGSAERFAKVLSTVETQTKVGMVYSYETECFCKGNFIEESSLLKNEAVRLGVGKTKGHYCAGTIFLARVSALRAFTASDIDASLFSSSAHSGDWGTLAHSYERLFALAVVDAGYTIRTLPSRWTTTLAVAFHKCVSAVLKFIFTVDKEGDKQTPYIVIFGFKIHLKG